MSQKTEKLQEKMRQKIEKIQEKIGIHKTNVMDKDSEILVHVHWNEVLHVVHLVH